MDHETSVNYVHNIVNNVHLQRIRPISNIVRIVKPSRDRLLGGTSRYASRSTVTYPYRVVVAVGGGHQMLLDAGTS